MNFRVTGKVAKKIKLSECINPDDSEFIFLETWFVHSFRANRKEYLIFTEAVTFYSFLIEGKGITNKKKLEETFNKNITQFLQITFPNINLKK